MVTLDATTKKLQVVLASSKSTQDCSWTLTAVDINTAANKFQPLNTYGNTNGTTAVDICGSPSGTDSRQVKWFSLNNLDNQASTVTIILNDGGTLVPFYKAVLQPGEVLQYTDGQSFHVSNTNGAVKTSGNTGLQGFQGWQGWQGNQGWQGLQGLQGLAGTNGLQGFQGSGVQGVQGLQGSLALSDTQVRAIGPGDLSNIDVFGREYLYAWTKKLMDGASPIVVLAGDSTTAGDSITNSAYLLHNLVSTIITRKYPTVSIFNDGVSGTNTETWRTTYLASQLARTPDLMIIRYGLNDGSNNRAGFETSLRSALTTIRAARTVDQMAVVLMTPNSTNDTPNGRDATWALLMAPIVRKAARDFQCTFIDTYSALRDSENASAWMDDPYGDGRHIHPLEAMNLAIANLICDIIFPQSVREMTGKWLRVAEGTADMFLDSGQLSQNRNPRTGAASNSGRGSCALALIPTVTGGQVKIYTSSAVGGGVSERIRVNEAGNLLCYFVPVYANNAAAVAGGLAAGTLYRTGGDPDTLCIVH